MSSPAGVRTPVVAANWKMHKGPEATRTYFDAFLRVYPPRDDRTVLFFPPSVSLVAAAEATRPRADLAVGVQNVYWEAQGAFTGEVGAPMAREAGARFALVGHSERRHVFGETDEDAARKVRACFEAGLTPMLCVGETLDQRQAGRVDEVVVRQLDAVVDGLPAERTGALLLAYEPVWAIGTGVNATPDDASAAHRVLRERLRHHIGDAADAVPILYGGSVKPDNAAALLDAPEVDGLLVGGASLDPQGFGAIASTAVARG